MPEDAVYMALDKPLNIIPSQGPGKETWVYAKFYSSDDRSIGMSSKINSSGGFTGTTKGPGGRNTKPTYQLEYDPANEHIKAESAIRIHVSFATPGSPTSRSSITARRSNLTLTF